MTTNTTISTGVTGFIGTVTCASSSNITAVADWASVVPLFLEYRVTAMELTIAPNVNSQTVVASASPSLLAVCQFSSGTSPANFSDVVVASSSKIYDARKMIRQYVDYRGFNDAQLWTSVANSPAADLVYGLTCADPGSAPASTASTVYFRLIVRYLVEFRSLG